MWPKLQALQGKLARAKAAADADATVAKAREAYLKALAPMYAAETAAGLTVPAAPGDPASARGAYSKGMKAKVEARIVSVRQAGGRTQVLFARGPEADPVLWKEEIEGVIEGGVVLEPGSVVTLDAVFTPGQEPAWKILGATTER
jgi:hypothetical protein